ncbi:MAG: 50S ribosomal protein L18 [Alphaproteobacteria bacterium]|nr:50S ribosomal protein L18 [Alphaproteobacteria bacterium]
MLKKDLLKKTRRRDRNRYKISCAIKASKEGRLRLSVFRSARHIYAQVIDDVNSNTKVAASSLEKDMRSFKGNQKELAVSVGKLLGERASKKGLTQMVADRGAYRYHGRVAAFFDGVREAGIDV